MTEEAANPFEDCVSREPWPWVAGARKFGKRAQAKWGYLRLLRISAGFVFLGAAVLLLSQGIDLLQGLVDTANLLLIGGGRRTPRRRD